MLTTEPTTNITIDSSINRELRDKQLKSNCENYKKIIYDNCTQSEQNDITVIKTIQNWAKDLEELFMLHDQAWFITNIAAEIIGSLKTIGVSDSKLKYVYEALSPFSNKYIHKLDHSIISQDITNRQELFYRTNAKQYYDALETLSSFDPTQLLREDAQKIGEKSIDIKEKIVLLDEQHDIPVCSNLSFDFEGIADKFQELISYRETVPAKTELSTELIGWGEDLIEVGKVVENEGIVDKETGTQMLTDDEIHMMAESVRLERFLLKPTRDRKWRDDWLGWIDTVSDSIQWFKHSASTKNKRMDFRGFYRELTREQIGARKESVLALAKKIYELTPWKLYFSSIWWEKVRIPSGADFSTRLSPKLSDRSIK